MNADLSRRRSRVRVPSLPLFTPVLAPKLEVGKERLSRRDRDDPCVVDGDLLEDEPEYLFSASLAADG